MIRDALLIAGKDLKIERSSRVLTSQVVPFGFIVLILFGFGISPDRRVVGQANRSVLTEVAPGLFWLAILFAALLAFGRSFAVESSDGNLDALRLAGIDPAGIFLGKATAVFLQLIVLEVLIGVGAVLFFNVPLARPVLVVTIMAVTTVAIAATGTLYGALAAGQTARDTLVPLLVLPALSPVLLAATRATESALFGSASDGWAAAGLVTAFALLYTAAGIVSFGLLLDET